ncbi:hypothetical protein LTR66_009680 [Elasticomyces elasticus]|nr:hypothetical protein LTR66_009680 [Elasticomyces elasticus]
MADENSPPTSPSASPTNRRRSSFAGQTLSDLFTRPSNRPMADTQPPPKSAAGPVTTATAQAQHRRLSLTTLGLSGSPNQTSPFGSFRSRRDSISSANSGSIDESAIDEGDAAAPPTTPATPFARRMSFGAKALRDVRTSNGSNGGGGGGQTNGRASVTTAAGGEKKKRTPSAATGRGSEGFNWSDNLRNRAERTSITSGMVNAPSMSGLAHQRAKSVATMEPPKEMPKPVNKPDHFQERILKGDFYMD